MEFEHAILVVDDDRDDRDLLRDALGETEAEHDFIEAVEGSEALKYLQQSVTKGKLPCLIVMDLNMPGMDGKATVLAIRDNKDLSSIPIVILSTSASLDDKAFFQQLGVEYLTKPVSFAQMKETATRLVAMCFDNKEKGCQ